MSRVDRAHSASDPAYAESEVLLQRRVALFALVFGSINLVGFLTRATALLIWPEGLSFVPPGTIPLQAVATASLFGLWAVTRGRPRSARFTRWAEATGILITTLAYVLIGLRMIMVVTRVEALQAVAADPEVGFLGVLAMITPLIAVSLIMTYAMVLRAAFVPTSVRHTIVMTTAVGLPLPFVAWMTGIDSGSALPFATPLALASGAALQWVFTVVICSAISRVIYGLRVEVRQAKRLGQYTLVELIGEGGMGMVYRASHEMLRRPTAIKLLPPDRAGEHSLERFEREVQLTAQLTHPNTVTIFDYGRTAEGVLYYAMELLDGATLEEVVEVDGPQPAGRVIRILEQVAGALGEAHAIGLIHRDVKPANILLSRQGGELDVAKVVDFGLVKELDEGPNANVSRDGTISGTPLYMAPEILKRNVGASPSSDIYALGAVGYYLLTGTHLFEGNSVIEVLGHHLHTPPEPPSRRLGDEVPEDLEAIILDCLAKDPGARPDDTQALRRRLEACDASGHWKRRAATMWWEAHGQLLATRRSAPSPAPAAERTAMTIDLEARARGAEDGGV